MESLKYKMVLEHSFTSHLQTLINASSTSEPLVSYIQK
jgi:hypothetical protein